MFNPYAEISTLSPLCQGDILVNYDATGDAPMRAGMVVTADCDLDKAKHDGKVSLISIVSAEEYINKNWSLDQLKK